jgi:hypothetical protein
MFSQPTLHLSFEARQSFRLIRPFRQRELDVKPRTTRIRDDVIVHQPQDGEPVERQFVAREGLVRGGEHNASVPTCFARDDELVQDSQRAEGIPLGPRITFPDERVLLAVVTKPIHSVHASGAAVAFRALDFERRKFPAAALVGRRGQQDDVGPLVVAAGTPDFLIPGFHAGRQRGMHHEAHTALVDAHAESLGRDQDVESAVLEIVLIRLGQFAPATWSDRVSAIELFLAVAADFDPRRSGAIVVVVVVVNRPLPVRILLIVRARPRSARVSVGVAVWAERRRFAGECPDGAAPERVQFRTQRSAQESSSSRTGSAPRLL